MSAAAHGDHDGHGCCETQGTGASNDQYGYCRNQTMRKARFGAEEGPAQEGEDGRRHYCRNEIDGNLVRQALQRRSAALRLADQLHNLCQHSVWAYSFRFHDQAAAGVQRSTCDLVARGLFDRHGFARHHRFIDGACAFPYRPVDRYALTWADAESVSALHLPERHVFFRSIGAEQMGQLRREIEQRANCAACTLPGAQFQHLAQENQSSDHRGRFEINGRSARHTAKRSREDLREKSGRDAVDIRGARAESNQREHVRSAVH